MPGLTKEQQLQLHRLLNRAVAYAVDCGGIPHDVCGDLTVSLQFATVKRTKTTVALSDDRNAREAEASQNGAERNGPR